MYFGVALREGVFDLTHEALGPLRRFLEAIP